jgi:two-component system response regulator MprA
MLADAEQPLVLLVESDARLASFVERALIAADYRVHRVAEPGRAPGALDDLAPDLVIVNPMISGGDGLELTRRLRMCSHAPIVLLSPHDRLDDRVAGLDAGADDYLARPFALEELLARLRALRRGRKLTLQHARTRARQGALAYRDVHLDLDAREAFRGARRLELRHQAFELLAYFLRHPERVLARSELLEQVWGYAFLGNSNVIQVTVSAVRQALEAEGEARLIHTIRAVGYILIDRSAPRAW